MHPTAQNASTIDRVVPVLLSTLAYRSRPVDRWTLADLDRLARAARSRNHAEGVSTLMLFDGQQIFQWLEGPVDALGRIWASMRRDPRHTAIEVLDRHPTPLRLFGDFDLKYAVRSGDPVDRGAVRTSLADELARQSIAVDPDALAACYDRRVRTAFNDHLFEAAARRLGDLWQADDCNEFEVALGLGRLQACLRCAASRSAARMVLGGSPHVLLAPLPGESHLLGASLDAEAMWRAGWHPQVEFPLDTTALRRLVAGEWFDVLDLSLSAAFRREHWLPRMKRTIEEARAASRNPGLVVVVAGRIFGESSKLAAEIGADASIASSSTVEQVIVRALSMRQLRRDTTLH